MAGLLEEKTKKVQKKVHFGEQHIYKVHTFAAF